MNRIRAAVVLALAVAALAPAEPQRRRVRGASDRRDPVEVGADEKNGAIEIRTVRVKQGTAGFFATPGLSYTVKADRVLDVTVDWKAVAPVAGSPKLTIDWGSGEQSAIACGMCRVERTLPPGTYPVTLRMDDGKGGFTKRTFTITASR